MLLRDRDWLQYPAGVEYMVGYMLRRATALSVLGQRAIINYVIR